MRIFAIPLSIFMLLLSFGCVDQAGEMMASLGQEVELKIGQTVSIEEEQFKVNFVEVVNDSRCAKSPQGMYLKSIVLRLMSSLIPN
jgi:Zn finger protein HypA/HybF involved in hydrogenase expression